MSHGAWISVRPPNEVDGKSDHCPDLQRDDQQEPGRKRLLPRLVTEPSPGEQRARGPADQRQAEEIGLRDSSLAGDRPLLILPEAEDRPAIQEHDGAKREGVSHGALIAAAS